MASYKHPIALPRRDALALGVPRYFTGRPCSQGHVAERHTSSGTCCECVRQSNERRRREVLDRSAGRFAYNLHPDDHAAALAYCQALDIQRGRMPQVAPTVARPARVRTPEEIEALRQLALGRVATPAAPSGAADQGLKP